MTQKQIRRSYSNEFKRNAVELSGHLGRQVNEVAEKLGITEQILTRCFARCDREVKWTPSQGQFFL